MKYIRFYSVLVLWDLAVLGIFLATLPAIVWIAIMGRWGELMSGVGEVRDEFKAMAWKWACNA